MTKKVVLEQEWTCSQCTMKHIPGLTKVCPSCGDPRDVVLSPEERPYLPSNAREITDAHELELANAGPDWNCGKCDEPNLGTATVCAKCGEPLGFNDTVNRKTMYTSKASHYDDKPNPLGEMIESDGDKAQRTLDTKAEGPRKLEDKILPIEDMPTSSEDVKIDDPLGDEIERKYQEQERMRDLPPWLQKVFPYRKQIKLGLIIFAVVLALAIAVTGIVKTVQYFTATVAGTVTISELQWERSVDIEVYRTIDTGDWSYPSDAYNVSSHQKLYGYDHVYDHTERESFTDYKTVSEDEDYTYDCNPTYEDNGNGTTTVEYDTCHGTKSVSHQEPFTNYRDKDVYRDDPIYKTWYDYEIDRWTVDRAATASGKSSDDVRWPEPTGLHQNNIPGDQVGEERVGDGRHAKYTVVYTDSNNVIHMDDVKESVWNSVDVGKTVPARYYERNGTLASVDWDSPVVASAILRGIPRK